MARLPYPSRESLPAELAELLESLPRNNITEMFAHATSLTSPFLRLAHAQFTALELSVRQRELVILAVAGLVDCEYEYAQHIPVSTHARRKEHSYLPINVVFAAAAVFVAAGRF